jgi:outer membrane protein OmpA-like peptidoglycan-associated protein
MKKFLLSLLMVAATTVAIAQEYDTSMRWQGFYTNRFWDNWEVSVGGGSSFLQLSQKWGEDPGKFFERQGWNANVGFTKWVAPIIGMRLQLDAGEFRNYAYDQQRYGSGVFKTPYMFVHGDILVNMSNWIGGYNPDRFYSAVSYMGFGYTAMSWTKKSQSPYNGEYAFTTGVINKFRITPRLDIELDLRSWIIAERSLPVQIQRGGRFAVAMSASVGVAYRFNQRNWSPAYSQVDVDGYLLAIMTLEERLIGREAELKRVNTNFAVLKNENETLRNSLAESRAESNIVVETIPAESVVFFNIGEAKLTDYAKATLDSIVAQLVATTTDIIVTGYADKETGSAKRNEQLSMERAECVANYLIGLGVPASRITTEWVGDTEQAFTTPETPIVNRCVIIRL